MLRERFAQAESSLETDDPVGAVTHALAAFDGARYQWRNQRGANGHPTPSSSLASLFSRDDPALQQAVDQLADFTEVQPFAADMGEYLWLTGLRARLGPEPTIAEARRVLVFTFEWILRWETFSARHDAAAAQRWRHELRPPRTDQSELGPRLTPSSSVKVVGSARPGSRPFVNVALQLVDAPEANFEPWLAELQTALRASWREAFPDNTLVNPTADRAGVITIPSERPDLDAGALVGLVGRAIDIANLGTGGSEGHDSVEAYRTAATRISDEAGNEAIVAVRAAFLDGTDTSFVTLRPVIELEFRSDLAGFLREPAFAHYISSATSAFVQVTTTPPAVLVGREVKPDHLVAAVQAGLDAGREDAASDAADSARRKTIRTEVEQRFRDALQH